MRRARKRSGRRGSAALSAVSAAACLAALLAACGPVTSAVPGGAAARAASGNTVTYALHPGGQASYIFPYISADNGGAFTVYNVNDFQYLLYRPLYWFGQGTKPYLNPALSLAKPPTYHGSEVRIQLKTNYKWSNGEPVQASDVVFFMNMMLAEAHTASVAYNCNGTTRPCKFWAATTGNGLPGDISDVRAVSTYVVAMHINTQKFSQTWFTDNELSQITPMPMAWDRTASGPSDCATRISSCDAVFNYLDSQAKSVSGYGSSPLWGVVDGPWRVKSLDPQGNLTLRFNDRYSGPVAKNHITTLKEVPYTTEQAEYNVLQDPTATQTIDVGYLPTVDAPVPPAGALVGSNPRSLTSYSLSAIYPWELSYSAYNFNNDTGQGAIFKQQYFRQVFQQLVDQEGVINGPLHGYGKPNFGPVAGYPNTKFLYPKLAGLGDQWQLNITEAKTALLNRGWVTHPGGQPDTCAHPGSGPSQCGAGVRAGIQLTFTLLYASGIDWMESAVRELVSNAALAGIKIILRPATFRDVITPVFTPSDKNYRKWQLAEWGSWTYSPDYLPTGDTLFQITSPNDAGGYNDPTNNSLINDTLQARTSKQFYTAMYRWQWYLAGQLPVAWQPNSPILQETINGLSIGPQNSALTIMPEMWYYRQ
jgi:peptide/nickel transport system substrate-binding protein